MLRKDTIKYENIFYRYGTFRYSLLNEEKYLDDYVSKIDVAESIAKAIDDKFIPLPPLVDKEIKNWYQTHISILKSSKSMCEHYIQDLKKQIEDVSTALINDYGEDLDNLYQQFLEKYPYGF